MPPEIDPGADVFVAQDRRQGAGAFERLRLPVTPTGTDHNRAMAIAVEILFHIMILNALVDKTDIRDCPVFRAIKTCTSSAIGLRYMV